MFESAAKKPSQLINASRILIVTTDHIYAFDRQKVSRKHKIINMAAFIKSSKSNEVVMNFPEQKDLRLEIEGDVNLLQSMIQLRFSNLNKIATLRIYQVPFKSLKDFYQRKNKAFHIHDNCRLINEEIPGEKDREEKNNSVASTADAISELDFKQNRFNNGSEDIDSSTKSLNEETKQELNLVN